jgi:hypothetical protein
MGSFIQIVPWDVEKFDREFIDASLRLQIRITQSDEKFSADRKPGFIYVADVYRSIFLHPAFLNRVAIKLDQLERKKKNWVARDKFSVGDLIDYFHRIDAAVSYLTIEIEKFESESMLGCSDETMSQIYLLDYFYRVRANLCVISALLQNKHARRKGTIPLAYNFCALCWRRVRHYESSEIIKDVRTKGAKFYCDIHSPSQETSNYNAAVKALVAAVKREKATEFKDDLDGYENRVEKPIDLPPTFERWFRSFLTKISVDERQYTDFGDDWLQLTQWLLLKAKSHYPLVYERIATSSELPLKSWREWVIHGVIAKLDDEKQKELEFWQAENVEDWTKLKEWRTILNIFARFEAYHYIQNSRPKVGRPGSKKEDAKSFIIAFHEKNKFLPSTEVVCSAVQTTKATVSKARKELNIK